MVQHSWVETAWGPLLLVWTEHGLLRSTLPGPVDAAPGPQADLPPALQPCKAWLQAYFAGHNPPDIDFPRDPAACPGGFLDVYREARSIPVGQVRTYGEIAIRCGRPKAARWVGLALGRNPWPPFVPCHRVVAANGKMGGFSAPGGVDTKLRLLKLESTGKNVTQALLEF